MAVISIMFLAFALNATPTVTLNTTQNSYYGTGGSGGEFIATTSDNGTFNTFCADVSHVFYTGNPYSYTISQNTGYTPTSKLSLGDAYLYSSFLNGELNSQLTDIQSYGKFAYALWYFNGENAPFSFDNDPFITYAENAGVGDLNTLLSPSDGAYGISVMNLYNTDGSPAQSQLVYVSDTTNTGMLLFGSLCLIGFYKKPTIAWQV